MYTPKSYYGYESHDNYVDTLDKQETVYKESAVDRCSRFMYDPQKGTIMGRNGKSWFFIVLFYVIFYGILFAFVTALLQLFLFAMVNEDVPMRNGDNSLLKLKPGLSMRPIVDFKTTLIRYKTSDQQTYTIFTQNLRAFLDFYEDLKKRPDKGFAQCFESGVKSPDDINLACRFDLDKLQTCGKENNYGYDRSQPCVILKLNKVYGWVPDILNTSVSVNPLVRCVGQNAGDIENFGEVSYYPYEEIDGVKYGTFSNLFFPFVGQDSYRPPLVAVQFFKLKMHVVLMVKCQLYNLVNPGTPIKFEMLVD